MILRRSTGELFTSTGLLIKKMHCPKGESDFTKLSRDPAGNLFCAGCSRRIVDTDGKDERALLDLVAADPRVCFLLDLRRCRLVS